VKEEALINICQAVAHGSARYVRNLRSHEWGKVVDCGGKELKVQVGDRRESWRCEECEDGV